MKNKAFDQSKYPLWIDPKEVTPYERNAKIHTDKQIENICTSIKRFGWQQDTVVTSDNVLVIGHGRREAAIRLGCLLPYHVIDKKADELTDKDIRELRIADNKTNEETGFDFDVLNAELDGLDFDGFDFDFDLGGTDTCEYIGDFFDRGIEAREKEPQYEVKVTVADQAQVDAVIDLLKENGYVGVQV